MNFTMLLFPIFVERPQSKCEQTRMVRMISFAIWKGQWTPNCYPNGDFKPKQCDNTGTFAHSFV